MSNPYNELLGMMRKEGAFYNTQPLLLGRVTKPLPNLEILADKMPLYKDDLLINEWLLARNNISDTTSLSEGHTHKVSIKNILKVNDLVLLARFGNEEKLVVISKVVGL